MPDILHLAIPGFVLLLVAEVIFVTISKKELFETRDTFSSLAMGIGNVVVGLTTKGVEKMAECRDSGVFLLRLPCQESWNIIPQFNE